MKKAQQTIKLLQAGKNARIVGPISILIAIVLILSIITPSFMTGYNLSLLLLSAAVYIVLAIGMTTVLISG